ncbi:MAG: STAS domain-containing protein [Brevinema sp.]
MQDTRIAMGLVKDTLLVHVFGRGTAEYCPDLDERIKECLENTTVSRVLFDAEEASYMDSSFIGIILAVKKKLSGNDSVFLLNPDDRIKEIFEVMGLSEFIPSLQLDGLHNMGSSWEVHKKLENTISDMRILLEAHQNIMETSSENTRRFQAVEQALKAEIEKKKNLGIE